jgi:hypothetical protein
VSRFLALIAVTALLAGCRHPEPEPETPGDPTERGRGATPTPDREATGIRLSYWGVGSAPPEGPIGGAAARMDGTLTRVGGCLVVESDGGVRLHPVFPAGTARWDPDAGTLGFEGRTYRPGDRITLGGGGVASPSAYGREAGVEIAPCEVGELWVVIA